MKREELVKNMVFSDGEETLVLQSKDNRNIWDCEVITGNSDEYIRHDYIFTDKHAGYKLVGFKIGDDIKYFKD